MRIRVTPEQYSLLKAKGRGQVIAQKALRVRKRPEELPENQLEAQIVGFLRHVRRLIGRRRSRICLGLRTLAQTHRLNWTLLRRPCRSRKRSPDSAS
jgi:hypothetical protein